jgi:hypothetical protein
VSTSPIWLRTPRFDLGLQLGALAAVAPPLVLYASSGGSDARAVLPLAALIAVPFVHVFGSFFFAFSIERNGSSSPPARLAAIWAGWTVAALGLMVLAPRALATFALLYGGWHILRQNFGFLRELAGRGGLGADRVLRRLDLAACAAPAVALWLLVAARGPWSFIGVEIHHAVVPRWLVALAFAAVPVTALLRERRLRGRRLSSRAGALLLGGNAAALLVPALLLDDLTVIYTLSASYHGLQYLVYLAQRERERQPHEHPGRVLLPLASAVVWCMIAWSAALALLAWILSASAAQWVLAAAWYAIVPFHYFVDGRIWKPTRRAAATAAVE